MAQFDVCRNANPASSRDIPYLLEVQSDLLDVLATRVVVPLVQATEMGRAAKALNSQLEFKALSSSCLPFLRDCRRASPRSR